MKRITCVTIAMGLVLAACGKDNDDAVANADVAVATNDMGTANDMGNAMTTTADTAFLTDAMKGDNGEVAIGKLAVAQGMSQKAKDFGTMLATEHGAHKDKVGALLTSAGGMASDEATDEGKANLAKLTPLKGAEFDKAFKAAMIEDHQKDIAKYEKQAAGSDAATAALAKDTLPTLKKHLETAKAL